MEELKPPQNDDVVERAKIRFQKQDPNDDTQVKRTEHDDRCLDEKNEYDEVKGAVRLKVQIKRQHGL